MSKKKSLGSSPIGYNTDNGSKMGFIPDLGVSKQETDHPKAAPERPSLSKKKKSKQSRSTTVPSSENKKPKKKIVSYNLEIRLIDKVKSTAKEKDMYYSGLVSTALKSWLAEQ